MSWVCFLAAAATWWAIMDTYHHHDYGWLVIFVVLYLAVCGGFAELARLDNMLRD